MSKETVNKDGTITYTAVPYPLPEAWRKEIMAGRCMSGEEFDELKTDAVKDAVASLNALLITMKSAIGFPVTKKYIPPRGGKLEGYMG